MLKKILVKEKYGRRENDEEQQTRKGKEDLKHDHLVFL